MRWSDIYLDPRDTEPYIAVREAVARGKHRGTPKSGRSREVQLSARLRRALLNWRSRCGTLGDAPVIPLDPANYAKHFARLARDAKLPTPGGRAYTPKDLRDTYVSQLLSAGIPLPYVSSPIGHADVATTARNYARWIGGRRYVAPPRLGPGEVPPDLLARLSEQRSKKSPLTDSPQLQV